MAKKKEDKRTNNDLQNVTQTPQKPGVNSSAPEGYAVSAPLVAPVMLL